MKTLVTVIALASSAAILLAQDEKQIQDAIRGLGSESFEEREKSTADLKKIGAPALEALKKAAASHDDPEVRTRAQRLVDELSKPAPPRKAAPGRGPARKGSVVSIRPTKDGILYSFQPSDGDAVELYRQNEGRVKLTYPDGKGGTSTAESESMDKFLEEHKDVAGKYGITKEGIEYGGSRLSFSMRLPAWTEPLELPAMPAPVPLPEFQEFDDFFSQNEDLRKMFEDLRRLRRIQPLAPGMFGRPGVEVVRGAQLAPVPDVLRTQLSIPEGQGVVIESVREGSTAAAAGLKRHDVVLEIDGQKVTGPADVRDRLQRDSKVKALRSGKEQMLEPAPPRKKEF
jgi:hypothetical protein